MRVGYARVSKHEQNDALQIDALNAAGCERIFTEKESGAKFDRKVWTECLDFMRAGDTLVVWKLDRVGRSLIDLVKTINDLPTRGIGFCCLTQPIDTSTPGGNFFFQIMAALAEFERALIIERTNAGLAAARARGKFGGNTYRLSLLKRKLVVQAHLESDKPVADLCQEFKISEATFYRYQEAYLKEREAQATKPEAS